MERRELERNPSRRMIHRGRSMAQGDIWVVDSPEGPLAIKDISRQPWLWRALIGRRSLDREDRMLRRLQGLPGIPRYGGRIDADALCMEFLKADRLPHRKDSALTLDFFAQLKDTVHKMHQRGVAHGDLRRKNILVCENQKPYLIDFTTGVFLHTGIRPVKRVMFRLISHVDTINILKIQRGYFPRSLTLAELRLMDRQPLLLQAGQFLRKRLYRPIKRFWKR